MSIRRTKIAFRCAAAFPLAFLASPALAQDDAGPEPAQVASAMPIAATDEGFRMPSPIDEEAEQQTGTGWEVTVTPYIWFSGLNGEVGVFPALPPVDVDISFGDVLENLKIAGMVALTVRKDRFVVLADVSYIDLGTSRDVGIRDPSFLEIELDTETFTSTLAAGYRAVDQGPMFVDVLAGARISSVNTELALSGPVRSLVADSSETWVDPVVGARAHVPLGGNWALALYGDIGGFGVSSDVTWQLLGTVQFAVSRSVRLAAGWRHYAVDYQEGAFIYDVSMSGPIVGASFDF